MPSPGQLCKCGHVSGAHTPTGNGTQGCLMCGCENYEPKTDDQTDS